MKESFKKLFDAMFSGSQTPAVEALSQPDSSKSLIGKNFEGYLVQETIGEGSQGTVYRVVPADNSDSQEYALKFCPREVATIEQELEDPNLPEPKRKALVNSLSLALNEDKRLSLIHISDPRDRG